MRVNVSDEGSVAAAIAEVAKSFGGLDTVIANAGVMLLGRDTVAADLDLAVWKQCLDVNLTI